MAETTEGTISIRRVFDAPPEVVWREWTEPARFADWYGGTVCEIPIETVSMDVRPGGRWKATMYCQPARREIRWAGEYVEVDEPKRLVLTVTDRPEEDARALLTVELSELDGGRTDMKFEQRGPMAPGQIEAATSGWGTFFDRIDARLAPAN